MNIRKEFILKLASEGKRLDGRGLEDFREIKIEKGPIENSEGSALVIIGKTEVLVGVKLDV